MTSIVMHAVPPSHPCMAVEAALRLKSLEYERIDFPPGEHPAEMERLYGAGHATVPGVMLDGEPVHGSRTILARLEALAPSPSLFPDGIADAVREAERWGDEQLQDLGRRLPWGALHFRPEAMGTFADAGELDPAGTDWAMRYVRATWKYHNISCKQLAEDLAGLPDKLAHVDALAAEGVVGGEQPTAADLQIGATVRVLLTLADLRPLLEAGVAADLARRWFPNYPGDVPAGAFPASWVPRGSASPSAART